MLTNWKTRVSMKQIIYKHMLSYALILITYFTYWVRAFASHAEGWEFESQPRQTWVFKAVSDSSTAKR